MQLDEILASLRDQHIERFKFWRSLYTNRTIAYEPLIRLHTDENIATHEVFTMVRVGFIYEDEKSKYNFFQPFIDEHEYSGEIFRFEFNELVLEMRYFNWFACEMHTEQDPLQGLIAWAEKWLDINEEKKSSRDGVAEVIHSITSPLREQGCWTFRINFGTAPVEAFGELMYALDEHGVRKVKVSAPVKWWPH